MKFSEAAQLAAEGKLNSGELLPNPSNYRQWFIMVVETSGKSFIIADEEDEPIVSSQLEDLFKILKTLGIRKAQITF